ncbi:unnamed protein product [Pleuronectes platessa]|uniref:Uncharacterized protein n=1 Tax=Pleuronectes platessa TaxID=8262 RepID=A0A9N7VSQ9_PLEPL|nr:unnamed protein product [Pleuronectes platessa]
MACRMLIQINQKAQFYYPYYYYYPLPQTVPATTVPATTVPATTVPATTVPATTVPATTAPATTALAPKYPIYYPYPPAGAHSPMFPDNADVYYYPIIQHIYGTPTYPSDPMQTTTPPPTSTTSPSGTTKPSETSPIATPATASTTRKTTKCSKQTTSSSGTYPGQLSPFVEYYESPFAPVTSYAHNKAGKLPDNQKYMPQNGYKSGPQAPAHSGFDPRAAPWFFH